MRSVRLPLSFGQQVTHSSLNFPMVVIGLHLDADDCWTAHLTDPIGGGHWIFPVLELDWDEQEDQRLTAQWLGYLTVEEMNEDHDLLHMLLVRVVGHPSQALRVAGGERLTAEELGLAHLEEEAVMHLQRYVVACGVRPVVVRVTPPVKD